ncbi:hypothetical protein FOZ62_009639 [Perkinsus olseni]|uniref:Uncharacterized protein n=1 Tax=Perkinsus olseni TaxID=32597 RepID=A0A7J6TZ13_PEROL|nr:hypothetical protein FOZ62_009639 [Perkinsus olseni]
MFGPSRDRADWMDDKAIAAVWVAVYFCLPDELLMINNGKSGTSSECQSTATEIPSPSKVLLNLTEGSENFTLIRAFISTLRSKCCPVDGEEKVHLRGTCPCRGGRKPTAGRTCPGA